MAYEYYLGTAGSEWKLSRVDLTVTPDEEIIGSEQRLSGTEANLARDVVANKKKWSISYKNLPGLDANVPDGGLGRDRLRWLYEQGGEMIFWVPTESGIYEKYTVLFEMGSFSDPRVKVEPFWRFDVSFGLKEV
jgi:hypothetical protein